MEILQAILLGIIHGFTEWLPVSSSAHLAFFFRLFQQEPDFFMIGLLHFATLLSLIIYFRKDIKSYLTTYTNKTQKWHMLAIILPFFIVGFFYHTIFEQFLTNFRVIGWALIVNGVLLFGTGFVSKSTSMSLLKAIGIGLSQIFVLIPGTSRTGLFVSSGAYFRLEKEKIKQYLVLSSIPILSGISLYFIMISSQYVITIQLILAMIFAGLSGYIALSILVSAMRNGSVYSYWIYCIVLGFFMLFN